ncbi:similar to Saccharomyces cerevisiae YOR145C PNO1 Essential nucleolar protein required for pre-18S rRNA processing [Maudiozyma barnettii]|uniref:Pre-rRNA-processing protein PNO1 n=1 Tax=Maudiozyma barnettii TaxID=61262 RepID=A0A8H2VDU0_9SACH|nr:Pno1p [Kazachstania barnettii]CAB4253729.1 similar to Saccharomyces cerevisiae YOR145C PNO1 Essential nucleolar protein required for pre-18S rRNA processing [Kazachstania barnettii]CAD1781477.1 similar to Saccharomyces cerevisiae YOR145C PNO1 Essential nucleolar protein required for pre-18S rRNA processing [Kazachstania barnettii]
MVAPTALKKTTVPETGNNAASISSSRIIGMDNTEMIEDDEDILIDQDDNVAVSTENGPTEEIKKQKESKGVVFDESGKPRFAQANKTTLTKIKLESRKIAVPPHRMTPLRNNWTKIYPPLVEHLKLQVRMNLKTKSVELRTNPKFTTDPGALQKGADFIKAFTLGFDLDDAIALLRLDDLYIETFEVKDVKTLNGDHLSRAIGRIAGKDGKTKFAIENATRTRIVLADSKIHILGGFTHIRMARESVVSLILGSPPGKVYGNLRTVASRLKERY